MAQIADIRVQGSEEFAALLRRASRSIEKKEMLGVLRNEAKSIQQVAKSDATAMVNPNRKTYKMTRSGDRYTLRPGMLSRSIKIITLKSADPVVIVAPKKGGRNKSNDAWFAHFVHEGTKQRQYQGKDRGRIADAKPFMNNAGSDANMSRVHANVARWIFTKLETLGL
jgi:hypothetical protein